MTEQEPKKGKKRRMSFDYSPEEEAALIKLEGQEPYKTLGTSRRMIMKHAILTFAADKPNPDLAPATRGDVAELAAQVRGLALIFKTVRPAGVVSVEEPNKRGPKPTKQTDEEKEAGGMAICEALGGVIEGNSCTYRKYEITAAGRPVDFEVSIPIKSLTQAEVDGQYSPSQDKWQRAKEEWAS
jgi:hypothetical protein